MKYFLVVLALLASVHATVVEPDAVVPEDNLVSTEHEFRKSGHGFGFDKDFHKPRKVHKPIHKPVHKPVHKPRKIHKFHHDPYSFYHKPKVCLKPILTGHLVHVSKHHFCDWYKPFGFEIKIAFKTKYHFFSYIVKICTSWHKKSFPHKIFDCSLKHAVKKCKHIGLPKCVTHKKFFIHRKKALAKCLLLAIKKCSPHGIVTLH